MFTCVRHGGGGRRACRADFQRRSAPIFKQYCVGCHNASDKEGQLVLDRYASLLSGGEHGARSCPARVTIAG